MTLDVTGYQVLGGLVTLAGIGLVVIPDPATTTAGIGITLVGVNMVADDADSTDLGGGE